MTAARSSAALTLVGERRVPMRCDSSMDGRASAMPKPRPCKHLFVDARVQVGKPFAELELLAVDGDRPERGPLARLRRERQVHRFGRQIPADVGIGQHQRARGALGLAQVHRRVLHRPEQPHQQVEEVDADVGDDAAGALVDALPRHVVPAAARRQVGELHDVPLARLRAAAARETRPAPGAAATAARCRSRWPGLLFQLLQAVEVPGVDDERLLADRVGADAQRQPHVRVVQIVRRADRHVVDALRSGPRRSFSRCRSKRSNSVKKRTSKE